MATDPTGRGQMQRPARGSGHEANAAPGIFDTIAVAMSALLLRPLPLLVPIVIDLYLSAGARLSPAGLLDPIRRWLASQGNVADVQITGPLEALDRLSRTGDLAAIVGWFMPSLLVDGGQTAERAVWSRPSLDLGGALGTLGFAFVLLLLGIWGAMAFAAMLARVVRGRSPLGDHFVRDSGIAGLRYLGFLGLVLLALIVILVPSSIVGAVLMAFGIDIVSLLVTVFLAPAVAAYVCLAFVGEAIVVANVGPLRACALSFGIVRRNVWPTVGFLLVLVIASAGLARLGAQMAGSASGLLLAIAAYAFVATGLALARMQFFYDRLRRWRADLIPAMAPA